MADHTWVQVEAPGEITDEMNAGSGNCDAVQQSTEVVGANSDEVPRIVDKPPSVAEETTPGTQTSKAPGFFAALRNKFCSGNG